MPASQAEIVRAMAYTVIDPLSVMSTHLAEVIKRFAHELFSRQEAKKLLVQLTRIGPHGRGYLPALQALRRAVLAHAAREEREEFPALLEQVSQPRRRMLGLEVRLTQALAPTRPHRLVNNELTNKLATPVFGPLDRGRDLLRRASART